MSERECTCRSVIEYSAGADVGSYLIKCPFCLERGASAQAAIDLLQPIIDSGTVIVNDIVNGQEVLRRCREAGWKVEG